MKEKSIAKLYLEVVGISRGRAFSARLRLYLIIAYLYLLPLILLALLVGPSSSRRSGSGVWVYWLLKLCVWAAALVALNQLLKRLAVRSPFVNNLLLFLFFLLSQLIFLYLGGDGAEGEPEDPTSFATPVAMQLVFMAVVGVEIFRRLRFFEAGVASGAYLRILDDKAGALGPIVKELSAHVPAGGGLSPKIELWLNTRTKSWLPSTHFSGGTFHLLIPRKFLIDSGKDPEVTRAVLAHEVGHIIQGDASLWLLNNVFSEALRKRVIPLAAWSASVLVAFSLLAVGEVPRAFAGAYVPIFIMHQFAGKVRDANTYSEHYADLAAAILASPFAILKALQYAFKEEAAAELRLARAHQAFQRMRVECFGKTAEDAATWEAGRLYKKFGIDVRQDPASVQVCEELGIDVKPDDSAAGEQVDEEDEYAALLKEFTEAEEALERFRKNPVRPTLRERVEYLEMVLKKYGLVEPVREQSEGGAVKR